MDVSSGLSESLERHRQYLQRDPNNGSLWMAYGDLCHQAGSLDEAARAYDRCLQLTPGHAAAQSRIASLMISQQRFVEAEQLLRDLLAKQPDSAALLHNVGIACFHQGRWHDAQEAFEGARKAGLERPVNDAYLARTLHFLGDFPAAIAAAQRWVSRADDTQSKGFLALLQADSGHMDMGCALAAQVAREDPDNVDANVVLGMAALEARAAERAAEHLSKALHGDARNGRAWLGMGLLHMQSQQLDAARDALQKALEIYPDNTGMTVTLGWIDLLLRNYAEAASIFKKAIDLDRNFSEGYAGLAATHTLTGRAEDAHAQLRLASRLNSQSFGVLLAQTLLSAATQQSDIAQQHLEQLLSRSAREGMPTLLEQLRQHAR